MTNDNDSSSNIATESTSAITFPAPVIYSLTRSEDQIGEFKGSPDYARFMQEYKLAIDTIIKFSDENEADNTRKEIIESQFNKFKEKLFHVDADDHSSHLYYQAKQSMEKIAQLLAGRENTLSFKLAQINDLANNILMCPDGTRSHIFEIARNLSENTGSLFNRMKIAREKIAQNVMSQHILTHREEIAARPGGHNDPVHLVTAYLNEFSGKFGVEKKTDIFIENFSIDDNDYKNCEDALRAGLSVYNMASFLAENYLNSAREIAVIWPWLYKLIVKFKLIN